MKPHGIPTRHRGRQYRSRLEARWASFFDRIGWSYEYEPFDLNGWIPDFILCGEREVLVEIKPTTIFPTTIAEEIERSGVEQEVLLLGCTIPIKPLQDPSDIEHLIPFGWLAERSGDNFFWWSEAVFGKWAKGIGFTHAEASWVDRISGVWSGSGFYKDPTLTVHSIVNIWADAGNTTQWMPPRIK